MAPFSKGYILYSNQFTIYSQGDITMAKDAKSKKDVEYIHIRVPITLKKDLEKIKESTGVNINSLCLEILWPAVKQRLKEIK